MINYTLKSRASNNSTIANPEDLQRGYACAHDVVPHLGCLPAQYPTARLGKHGYLVCEAGIQKGEESENSDARGRSSPFSFRIKTCLASKWAPKRLCAQLTFRARNQPRWFPLEISFEWMLWTQREFTFSFNLGGSLLPVGVTNLVLFGLFFNGFASSF